LTVGLTLRLSTVMLLWAGCFPLITVGLNLAPHLAFAALRAALAGACLLAVGAVFRRRMPRGARTWMLIGVVALGATSLGFFGVFHAAEFVSPGLATVIANAQPLLAAILAQVFLGERLGTAGKAGLVAGFAGIAAIAWPGIAAGGRSAYLLGIGYVALAAVGVASGNIAIKRLAGQSDAVMTMGAQLLIGAIPLGLLSLLTEDVALFTWSREFILVLVVLSVLGTSLAFWLWFAALEQVELSRANAFTFLVPLFGLVIGATLFAERLAWTQAAGAALVLTGIVLAQRGARMSRPSDLASAEPERIALYESRLKERS